MTVFQVTYTVSRTYRAKKKVLHKLFISHIINNVQINRDNSKPVEAVEEYAHAQARSLLEADCLL